METEELEKKELENNVVETEVDNKNLEEAEAEVSAKRLKKEENIDSQELEELEASKKVEELRQKLGLEKEDDKSVLIESQSFLKKLGIPFETSYIDKKRETLLEDAQKEIKSNLDKLEVNKVKSAEIKKAIEEFSKKLKNLDEIKAQKKKELQDIKKEAEEYIENTKPPILRASTKEKLARSRAIVDYFKQVNEGGEPINISDRKNISPNYYKVANEEFNRIIEKDSESKNSASNSEYQETKNKIQVGDNELEKIKHESTYIANQINDYLEIKEQAFKTLEEYQKLETEKKENYEKVKVILANLIPEKIGQQGNIDHKIAEKQKITKERSEKNIVGDLSYFLGRADSGQYEKAGITSKEEAIQKLKEEIEKVKKSFFVTINLHEENLQRFLESGRYKSTLELPEKLKRVGETVWTYEQHRIEAEKNLGIFGSGTEEDPYAIVGAVASENSHDESNGAAEGYGDIFLKLRQEVVDRGVFINGDSLKEAENMDGTATPGLDRESAIVAKAIRNIVDKCEDNINYDYVEADILGGVKTEDVESINIKSPDKFLSEFDAIKKRLETESLDSKNRMNLLSQYNHKYECYKRSKEELEMLRQKFPKYASLIKEV